MKPLMLSFKSIFISQKNELKIFLPMEMLKKGILALKWLLLEQTTLPLVRRGGINSRN